MPGQLVRVLAVSLLSGLAACERPTEPNGPAPIHAWVVGEAARSLDGDGRFVLPVPAAPGPHPITTPAAAADLAAAFLRIYTSPTTQGISGSTVASDLEHHRRAEIDFTSLVPADRVFYAESPYQPIDDPVPPFMRKIFGSFFLVPFLDRNDPAVVMASSAYNTEIQIVDERLVFPPDYGSDFWWLGIPVGTGFILPIMPERAVETVWNATGTRVNRVPELIAPSRLYFPHYARWRVALEAPVRVRGVESGLRYTTSELYVSARIGHPDEGSGPVIDLIEVALPQQPQQDTLGYRCPGELDAACEVVVERKPGFPIEFESVQVVQ